MSSVCGGSRNESVEDVCWMLSKGGVSNMSHWEENLGQSQDSLERRYLIKKSFRISDEVVAATTGWTVG